MAATKPRMRSRLNHTRELKTQPRGLAPGADPRIYVTGVLLDFDAATNRAQVAINGGSGSWVPALPVVDYSTITDRPVWVGVNPWLGGRAVLCFGPVLDASETPAEGDIPSTPPAAPDATTTRVVTLGPSWTGTYRADVSAWDRWNLDRYGGRSTMYQGTPSWDLSKGPFTGLAVYGEQIENLNATTIDEMVLTVRGAGLREASYPDMSIKASTNGTKPTGAPSVTGAAFSAAAGKSDVVEVTVPSALYAGFAAGTTKGFAVVGTSYNACRGTSAADAMTLKITYTAAN